MEREFASVWTRFGALIIDGLLIVPFYIPFYVLSFRAGTLGEGFTFNDNLIYANFLLIICGLIFGLWNTIYRMGKTGQSFGRKFLNIAVLDDRGKPIGVGSAALREIIGRFISGLVCYIGYLNAFWDKKNQMWHDKIASCYVFYVDDNFS